MPDFDVVYPGTTEPGVESNKHGNVTTTILTYGDSIVVKVEKTTHNTPQGVTYERVIISVNGKQVALTTH